MWSLEKFFRMKNGTFLTPWWKVFVISIKRNSQNAAFCITRVFNPLTVFWLFLFMDITKTFHQGVKNVPFFMRKNFSKDHIMWRIIKPYKNGQFLKKINFFDYIWLKKYKCKINSTYLHIKKLAPASGNVYIAII